MANKHKKKYSASFVTSEMHIETTMRYHSMTIRRSKIQNLVGILSPCWYHGMAESPLKTVWHFLLKVKRAIAAQLSNSTPSIYSSELKTHVYTKSFI